MSNCWCARSLCFGVAGLWSYRHDLVWWLFDGSWQESIAEAEKSELILSIWQKNSGRVGNGDDASGTFHSAKASELPMFSLVDASRIR